MESDSKLSSILVRVGVVDALYPTIYIYMVARNTKDNFQNIRL